METANIKQKMLGIKSLFNDIRDSFSRNEINEIRANIYKEAIYDYLSQKDKLKSNE